MADYNVIELNPKDPEVLLAIVRRAHVRTLQELVEAREYITRLKAALNEANNDRQLLFVECAQALRELEGLRHDNVL